MLLISFLLSLQIAVFGLASLVHAGILAKGLEHARAAAAGGTIVVLATTALLLWLFGAFGVSTQYRVALGAQLLAPAGTLIGAVMIAVGVGPQTQTQTQLDMGFHVILLAMLLACIAATVRAKPRSRTS